LVEVDAKFPTKDNQFDPIKRAKYEDEVKNKKLPNLEKQRKKFLSKDFSPNKTWWDSKVTKD